MKLLMFRHKVWIQLRTALVMALLLMIATVAFADAVVKFNQAVASGFANIAPTPNLTVDLDGYAVPVDAKLLVLQVRNNYYTLPLEPGKNLYQFSADSGEATKNSAKFSGLKALDPVFINIGREAFPDSLEMGAMVSHDQIMVMVKP